MTSTPTIAVPVARAVDSVHAPIPFDQQERVVGVHTGLLTATGPRATR